MRPYHGVSQYDLADTFKYNVKLKPYVPAQHRQSAKPDLPWIDQFLAVTPPSGVEAVFEELDEAQAVLDGGLDLRVESVSELPDLDRRADEWALEEAADELDELAQQIELAMPEATPSVLFRDSEALEELSEWSDDDMVDIMPMSRSFMVPASNSSDLGNSGDSNHSSEPEGAPGVLPAVSAESENHSESAAASGRMADRLESAESAAQALEVLAQRVRAGELSLAGYEPRMGNAAALAAALTALLGATGD